MKKNIGDFTNLQQYKHEKNPIQKFSVTNCLVFATCKLQNFVNMKALEGGHLFTKGQDEFRCFINVWLSVIQKVFYACHGLRRHHKPRG